jgi:hypothetical protein
MSKKIIFAIAAATLLLSAPAFAQEEPPVTTEEPPVNTEEPSPVEETEEPSPVEETETEEPAPVPISSCCKKQTVTIENVASKGSTVVLVNSEAKGVPLTGEKEIDESTIDDLTDIVDRLVTLVKTPVDKLTAALRKEIKDLTTELGKILKQLAADFSPKQLAELLPDGLVDRISDIQEALETLFPFLTDLPSLDEIFPIDSILDILFPK